MIEVLTPVGRMVSGHPLEMYPVTDDKTNQPKLDSVGNPRTSTSIGIAIPKGQEKHWNETAWGAQIWNEGVQSWPNGEWRSPVFAWKVIDGDSNIPNKRGHKPCDREGYPGHWVIMASTELSVKCYHAGRYEPHQAIQRKEEIKRGDYIRLFLSVKGNNPSQSPGVYINPTLFELTRAGIEIISANAPDAAASFGSVAAQLPPGAMIDPNAGAVSVPGIAAPAAGVTPHMGFVTNAGVMPPPTAPAHVPPATPVKTMTAKAAGATYDQFIANGWTDDAMIAQGYMAIQ
jgi:hypothetical protein